MKWLEKNPLGWLVVACLAIFFANLDVLVVNIMEARNFVTAREMLEDGNWILTTLNGEPRYQKPPLPTWLTALSGELFGLKNIFTLRVPAALLALVLVVSSFKFSEKIFQHRSLAFIASLILATSFYVISAGRDANWDIFAHGFMMVCIYQLYLFFTSEGKGYRSALLAALFFGASFMSKGPVSMYVLLLPFLISFGIVYKFNSLKRKIIPFFLFLLVSFLLSAWWYWYTYTFDPETVTEITKRETSNWTGYNIRPFYYYWSFFTQSGVWTIPAFIGLLFPYLRNRVYDKKGYLFTFLWTIGSLILLSVVPEKKSRYLLPVLIPLAFNTAFYMDYLIRRFKALKDWRETFPVYFNFGLISIIGLAFPLAGYLYLGDRLEGYWFWYVLLSITLFMIGFIMLRNLIRKNIKPVFFLTIAFIMAVICFGMPIARTITYNPEYRSLALLNEWQADTKVEVYEFGGFTPELIWAYGKSIPVLTEDGVTEIPSEESFGILIAEENLEDFQQVFSDYSIEKVSRYDMNPQAPGTRTHRPRLWRDLYLVKKR